MLTSLKTTISVAGATIISGVSTIIGIIPEDIGKLASFAGFILSCYMIIYWRKNTIKLEAEIQLKKLELEHAIREAEHRRRSEDI